MDNTILQQAEAMAQETPAQSLALSLIFSHHRELQLSQCNNRQLEMIRERDHQLDIAQTNQATAEQAFHKAEDTLRTADRHIAQLLAQTGRLIEMASQRYDELVAAETRQKVAEERLQDAENDSWNANQENETLKRENAVKDEKIAELQLKYDQEQQAHQETREILARAQHAANHVKEKVAGLAAKSGPRKRKDETFESPLKKRTRVKKQ